MATNHKKSKHLSRHVFTVGKILLLIHNGLHRESLPKCMVQHLLMEIGSCQISAHSARESKAHCSRSTSHVSTTSAYTLASSANNFRRTSNFLKCFIKSLMKMRSNSGPIPLPLTMPLISSVTIDSDISTRVWCVRLHKSFQSNVSGNHWCHMWPVCQVVCYVLHCRTPYWSRCTQILLHCSSLDRKSPVIQTFK